MRELADALLASAHECFIIQAMAHALVTQSPPQRFRVTLLTTFAWLTVLTLVASHIYTSYQLQKAKQEIVKLQDQLGVVRVADPTRLTAVSADMTERYLYRFLIFRPQDRQLVLRYAFDNIGDLPFIPPPAAAGEIPIFLPDLDTVTEHKAGEFIIELALVKEETKPHLQINILGGGHSQLHKIEIPGDTFLDHFLLKTKRGGRGGSTWSRFEQRAANTADVPLVLLRITEGGSTHLEEGLMVWLEDAAPPTAP